jgi:protein-S-isoprenylcysteine O-methyltransferase Ste14/uncharacterized membrane protein (UPF0127 family)
MPIHNDTRNITLMQRVVSARSIGARLVGLLGTYPPDKETALHILPCDGVHTFGMRYPIDTIFLDKDGSVVKVVKDLRPNRVTRPLRSAASALEFPAGTLAEGQIRIGDRLRVEADDVHRLSLRAVGALLHWPLSLAAAALWLVFVYFSYLVWRNTGQVMGLGFLAVNALMCILFLTRRRPDDASLHPVDWTVALGVAGVTRILVVMPETASSAVAGIVTLPIQTAGFIIMLASYAGLGRSFGLVPANRGVKTTGMYRIVRHPAYAGALLVYLGFLLANMSVRSLTVAGLLAAGQVYRLLAEERLLKHDDRYLAYMKKVRHRLIPGIL